MFGLHFMKALPTMYVLQFKKGRVVREGTGLCFFYGPMSSLVAIPVGSKEVPFIFEEATADFQEVSVQGQVTYRVAEPKKLAGQLNFTLQPNQRGYVADDPERLPQRVINQVQVLMQQRIQAMTLRETLLASERLSTEILAALQELEMLRTLGLEVINLSVLAVKPNPETARALEAEMREQLLLEADEAIYHRRNAAVQQERTIRENELQTEIAVENKKREIREAKIEADRAVQAKTQTLQQEAMDGKITLEEQNRELVTLTAENSRAQADAQAYGIEAVTKTFAQLDPKVTQSLASVGMNPAQMIALSFQTLAENADKIGNLNIAPELLQELITKLPEARK